MLYNSYHKDLRERVLEYVDSGGSKVKAAEFYKVGESTIHRWLKQRRDVGHIDIKPLNRKPYKLDYEEIEEHVKANPDNSLKEIAEKFETYVSAIAYALKKLKITRKKN